MRSLLKKKKKHTLLVVCVFPSQSRGWPFLSRDSLACDATGIAVFLLLQLVNCEEYT